MDEEFVCVVIQGYKSNRPTLNSIVRPKTHQKLKNSFCAQTEHELLLQSAIPYWPCVAADWAGPGAPPLAQWSNIPCLWLWPHAAREHKMVGASRLCFCSLKEAVGVLSTLRLLPVLELHVDWKTLGSNSWEGYCMSTSGISNAFMTFAAFIKPDWPGQLCVPCGLSLCSSGADL